MGKLSQFYKTILLLILSVVFFLGFKAVLPDRLFSENLLNDPSMLIDSILLDLLDGGEIFEPVLIDTVYDVDEDTALIADLAYIEPDINIMADTAVIQKDTTVSQVYVPEDSGLQESVIAKGVRSFKRSDFAQKLAKRKPMLFLPEKGNFVVTDRPIIDTLLDPALSVQGYGYLQRFYSKLRKLEENKSGKIRIAYFGDSMNDGDLIVQDFRSLLQDNFGGYGVGFVSISSLSSASRGSVYHKHSDAWHVQSFITSKKPSTPFGIDGQVFLAGGGSGYWVSYAAGTVKNSSSLYNPTLFYGRSDNNGGYVNVSINKTIKEQIHLTPEHALNVKYLGQNTAKSVNLNFGNIQNIPIYGLDFSSNMGVYVDNFSLRGNSGLTLVGLNSGLMNAFDRVLHYDLIVLHYGTNVLNYGSHDYSFYEKGMKAVIHKLRACFPHADILVISTADKSSKINMKMETDPAVIALTKAQKNFSRNTGCGYIDLYSLMGGYGSMVDWVNRHLANKDYTHFNVKGSKEVGTLLFQELENGYNKYKIQLARELKKGEGEN